MGCKICGGDEGQYCVHCEPKIDIDEANRRLTIKIIEEASRAKEEGFYKILDLHARALACHCECLGMNAENCVAACNDTKPPFRNNNYVFTLHKWGLTNEKGEPLI